MSGAELLDKTFSAEEAAVFVSQPRVELLPLLEMLAKRQKTVHTIHEQATIHAADGYARVTGKTGVAVIASGQGVTNAITGLATAYMDSVPLVVVIVAGKMCTQSGLSDENVDIGGITMPVTKHTFSVTKVSELVTAVQAAFRVATEGRPGPAVVFLSNHVLTASCSAREAKPARVKEDLRKRSIPDKVIRAVADVLKAAKKPVILTGGGLISSGSTADLREFVEKMNIPVVSTLMGLGAFPSDHALHLGMAGMHGTVAANRAIHRADVLVILGMRFSDRVTGKIQAFSPNSLKIHVEIDPSEINKIIAVDIPVAGDVSEFLTEINKLAEPGDTNQWVEEALTWTKTSPQYNRSKSILKPQDIIRIISEFTPDDAIVATDVGQHQIWTALNYSFRQPRTFLTSGGLGTMGYGLPAAIGATLGGEGRRVICICGDGGFQMNIQELHTIVRYQLPVKIIIMNNGYLGMVRQWQELFYNRRYSSVKISSPDYLKLAEAYGIPSYRADDYLEARRILQHGLALEGPALLEFNVNEEENVFPIVPPGESTEAVLLGEER